MTNSTQPPHALLDGGSGGCQRDAHVVGGAGAEGGAGRHGHVDLLQEPPGEGIGVQAAGGDVHHGVEGALGLEEGHAGGGEDAGRLVAVAAVLVHHLLHAVLGAGKRGLAGLLGDGGGAGYEGLLQLGDLRRQGQGGHRVAQAASRSWRRSWRNRRR